MCKWGTTKSCRVHIPAHLSYTGKNRIAYKAVDSCIVDIVRALNRTKLHTVASCCGHGKRQGNILLSDGRELIIKGTK